MDPESFQSRVAVGAVVAAAAAGSDLVGTAHPHMTGVETDKRSSPSDDGGNPAAVASLLPQCGVSLLRKTKSHRSIGLDMPGGRSEAPVLGDLGSYSGRTEHAGVHDDEAEGTCLQTAQPGCESRVVVLDAAIESCC